MTIAAELAKRIVSMRYEALPVDDPTRRCPDITRAKQLLGWEPRVSIEEGLKQTIEYFRAKL